MEIILQIIVSLFLTFFTKQLITDTIKNNNAPFFIPHEIRPLVHTVHHCNAYQSYQ